jgi:FkbM family methyltransferase
MTHLASLTELETELQKVHSLRTELDARTPYGAIQIAARYCGLRSAALTVPGQWQHGWTAPDYKPSPQSLFGEALANEKLWVARKDQEHYLKEQGYASARAIGLPCVYVPRSGVERIPNTLLVVPAHSLSYTTHLWKFDEFADQVATLKDDFDVVAAVVHGDCIEKGYWAPHFREHGITVFPGAKASDPTSLIRLEMLFSAFDCLVSNKVGSHIAYASLWGARVSLFGTYVTVNEEDYANDPFYRKHPELLGPAIRAGSEQTIREQFSGFFIDHPKSASQRIEWAEYQLGVENRLLPQELKQAFGWTLPRRTASRAYASAAPIAEDWLPESIKRPLRKKLYPQTAFREDVEHEATRLSRLPQYESGSTAVLGSALRFPSGPSCAYQLKSIFGQEVYKFKTLNPTPLIIDGGANIGIASIYFARHFSQAKILAFEPDPKICDFLNDNLRSFQVTNVEVHQAALWTDDKGVSLAPEGGDAGKVVSESSTGTQSVASVRLRDLLDEPVDLLKLDVEGAQVDLLIDCADRLQNVDRLFVEYHSQFGKPQRMQEIIAALTHAGFRLHVITPFSAEQPFVHRPVKCGYDLLMEIFAIRQ